MPVSKLDGKVTVPIPACKYRADFARKMVEAFGGVTITEGFGCWSDQSGYVIHEPVRLLSSNFDFAVWQTAGVPAVGAIVGGLFESGELAVLVEVLTPKGPQGLLFTKE